jgi:hemerythrin-like domain-containing protein
MSFTARKLSRRNIVLTAGAAVVALTGCGNRKASDVTANEDLMREHGIIRRALFIYGEASRQARENPASIPVRKLLDTAVLFRQFAEDYHERAVEETHIFPVVRRLKGAVSQLPDVLLIQHQRGREITDYVARVAGAEHLGTIEAERLASTLDAMIAMYGPHAAREDTDLFPAWKTALGPELYDEMGERFEELEHEMFGHDGFEDAHRRIADIETSFGLQELARVTPPAPPS